jgi:DNA-binding MarR family transcriptional regulator
MTKPKVNPVPPKAGEAKRGTQGHIAYLLRQAQASVRLVIDADLAQVGLTTPQLARIASLTPQTVNLIVRKLEADALIQRSEHETHGRVLNLAVTADGHVKLHKCKLLAGQTEARILALLDSGSEDSVRRWLSDVAVLLTRTGSR